MSGHGEGLFGHGSAESGVVTGYLEGRAVRGGVIDESPLGWTLSRRHTKVRTSKLETETSEKVNRAPYCLTRTYYSPC